MDDERERLLTVPEVADYFRVDEETVRRWLRRGELRGINLGSKAGWRVRYDWLMIFVTGRTTGQDEPSSRHDDGGADQEPG